MRYEQEQTGQGSHDVLRPRTRGRVEGIAIGAVAGAVGVGVASLLMTVSDEVLYGPLIAAVVLAMWAGGGEAAVAALTSGWLLAVFFLVTPRHSFGSIASGDNAVRWGSSLVGAIVIAAITYRMRRGHELTADAAERVEQSRLRVVRLQELAASLSAALTPGEVAAVMVESMPAAIGARGGALGLLEGDELVIVDPVGAQGQTLEPGLRMPLGVRAPITTAAREGKPVWAQRRGEFVSQFADGAALAPYASGALAVPVFMGDRLVGAMGFPFVDPDAVTLDVRTVARIAAELGGQALERAELYAQERSSREALDRILAVAPRFLQGATPELVAASVCVEARRTFGCDVAQIWTPLDAGELEVTWRDPPVALIPPGTRIPFGDFPMMMDEMEALRSMFVPNVQVHSRGEAFEHAHQLDIFSSLRIPIVIGARFERILTLQWHRVIPEPAPPVVAVARRFADQAGLAIEQSERRRAQELTRSLQAVTEALAAAVTPADVGRAIVSQGVGALRARAATVYALSEDGESVELVASEGYGDDVTIAWGRLPLETEAPVTDAIRSGDVVVCASPADIAARYPWFDETEESFVAVPLIAAGRAIGAVFVGSFDEPTKALSDLSLVVSLARQAAQALDRARLFEREQASVDRLQKLQAVTAGLSKAVSTVDVSRTCLEHAATGVGAAHGVVVLRKAGETRPSVVASVGSGTEAGQAPPAALAAVDACLKSGQAVIENTGWVAFPLASGALCVQLPAGRGLAKGDHDWLATLVGQGAQALDRAGRYETERGIAETLQRSVLPDRLPDVHGVELAARYLPGTVGVDVGGDWYDAIQLADGRIGLVVGDVVGKGVQAAAMMGQLRNALRAFAFEHTDPYEVVSRLGKLVDGMLAAPFATLAYLVVDPGGRGVDYVVAGHPPPLIRTADGSTTFLDGGRALPIGVDPSLGFEAGHAQLAEGSAIVLYTDGLVERRGQPLDEGLELLATAASRSDGDPEELVDSLVDAMGGDGERADDIAVVVLRFSMSVIEALDLTLSATPDGLVEMRQALRSWLAAANVDADSSADVVLAVWEASVNAVEHAQEPTEQTFGLGAKLDDGGKLRVEVRDSGGWKPGSGSTDRGLGLGLMRSLMDHVVVTTTPNGTIVVLERRVDIDNGFDASGNRVENGR